MSDTGESDARKLARLREKIDAIDAEVHRLLIERGTVIDALIRTKGTGRPGAAFRPGREADMMRRLVERHSGDLPLATVEHIWREIITTFTRMQAPFDLAIDGSADTAKMRDLARFYFGFSVKLVPCAGPAEVIAQVSRGRDLGLIAADRPAGADAWWRALVSADAPRIMALLPFIRAEGRPADQPAFVVSPKLADPTPPEHRVFAAVATGDIRGLAGIEVLETAGRDVLLATAANIDPPALASAAGKAGVTLTEIADVGGFAEPIVVASGIAMRAAGAAR